MNTNEHAQHRLGVLLVASSAIAWSTAGFFARLIALDAWTMLFWRGIFGGALLACYVVWLHRRDTFGVLRSLGAPGWAFIGVGAVAQITFICSLTLTTVANVVIVYATAPFIAAALAWMWLREKLSAETAIASLVALCGVAVMMRGAGLDGGNQLGNVLAFAMTIAFAAVMVMTRRYRTIPLVPAVCVTNLMTALVTLPFATVSPIGAESLFYLTLFGFFQITLGLTLFTAGSRLIPAAQAALIGAIETPLAPLWVWLAFGETPSADALLGGAIVMTAVAAYMFAQHRRGFGATRTVIAADTTLSAAPVHPLRVIPTKEPRMQSEDQLTAFATHSVNMSPHWLVTFQAPEDEVDSILEKVTQHAPLEYGNYDKCALRSAGGVEYYRPREGAHAGAEDDVRKRPGVVTASFLIPRDQAMLQQAVDAIAAAHSYEEPVITVQEVLASRSRTIGDKNNPNRWWNRGGDWKAAS